MIHRISDYLSDRPHRPFAVLSNEETLPTVDLSQVVAPDGTLPGALRDPRIGDEFDNNSDDSSFGGYVRLHAAVFVTHPHLRERFLPQLPNPDELSTAPTVASTASPPPERDLFWTSSDEESHRGFFYSDDDLSDLSVASPSSPIYSPTSDYDSDGSDV